MEIDTEYVEHMEACERENVLDTQQHGTDTQLLRAMYTNERT